MSKIIYATTVFVALGFMILPLFIVLPLAFNDSAFLGYPFKGFSWRWFEVVFSQSHWRISALNSLIVATGATAFSLVVGGFAAMGVMASSRLAALVLTALFISPLVMPSIVLAIGIFYVFAAIGLNGGFVSLILAHTVLGAPLVFLSAISSLKGLNPELDRAGASMGASRSYRFFSIILPLTAPGYLVGALFAFITSFDEVVIALFLSSPRSQTLPVALFTGLRDRLEPTLVVIAVLLTMMSMGFLWLLARLQKTQNS